MLKKILMLCMYSASLQLCFAQQNTENTLALDLIHKNSSDIGLTATELENVIVSNVYFNKMSGTYMVYLQQSYLDIPVFNTLTTLAFKNGKLVYKAGDRIESIEKRTRQTHPAPSISAESAATRAMALKKIFTVQPLIGSVKGQKINFGKLDVTKETLTAELMWVPTKENSEVVLAWQINLAPSTTSDNWLIRLDASTNELIAETNLTVYCNFDHPDDHHSAGVALQDEKKNTKVEPSFIVNGGAYRVVPYPAESPIHPGGTPDLRTNPWTMAPGNATSLKWHSDGSADYNYTRGNNVWAYHDRSNDNTPGVAKSAMSTTSSDPLVFDFIPEFSVAPTQTAPVPNQQFNITNLFYWNNIIHDLAYQYGFDEPSGNFQFNNQGRGGVGNDFVRAEAQDAGALNNANFNSPADGSSGVMQMYLWGGGISKDGDADNGIIIHEFTHGISSRLTGGPSQSGCLGNNEQMGEGWSDYISLMATQNWESSTISDGFTKPRGIGVYASSQAVSGPGIRPRRYTTNMAINEMTYANLPQQAIPHGVGFVWCTMLWDMTWEIIQQAGINPNLFDPTGAGGNTIALKLVIEAMKLQPCSPGFVDGRNAILMADQLLYGGQYRCAIVKAFARRGLGFDANQGSSNSQSDGTAGFSTIESELFLTQDITAQVEGLNVSYNNKVVAGPCVAITNYLLTDTLPANVTYVSGGTYNPANRVVSFAVNIAAGQAQDYNFTVRINSGSWFPTVNLFEDNVISNNIPATWTPSSTTGTKWIATNARSHTAPFSYYCTNPSTLSELYLTLTNGINLGPTPPPLTFWHWFNTESTYDGNLLESSIDGGATWNDMGPNIISGNYTGTMATNSNSPIGGRPAWTGNSHGFIKTEVNLNSYANKNLKIRFRGTTDDGSNSEGWYVDDIAFKKVATVNMRSGLFNSAGLKVNMSDTFTVILEQPVCNTLSITTQPANTVACDGSNAAFSVIVTGTSPGYQWQVSTDAGASYINIPGANSASLNVSASGGLNNNLYRVIVSNGCPSSVTSSGASLMISNTAAISLQPESMKVCLNGNTSFTASALGSGLTYQWQLSTDGGASFNNIPGANSPTINLNAVSATMNNYQYRMLASSCGPGTTPTNVVKLSVINPANILNQPANSAICPNENASFSVTASGTNLSYQWQVSTDAGITYLNIPLAVNTSLNIQGVTPVMNDHLYRVMINGDCTANLASAPGRLTVNKPVTITTGSANNAACQGSPTSFSVSATGTSLSYQWQESVNGNVFVNLGNSPTYSGVNSPVLTINSVSAPMNGNAYRASVTGFPCGTVNSPVYGLVVYPLPSVLINTNTRVLTPAINTTISANPAPGGSYIYQWYLNNVLLAGTSSAVLPVYVDGIGEYKVSVTNTNGCTNFSNIITITDSLANDLFIYPNPTTGKFQVRYFLSNGSPAQGRTILVYDSKGSRVLSKQFNVTAGYSRMDVNLVNVESGIYLVELRDMQGKRLEKARVLIQ